ncbi:hypothetical protein BC351_18860 [Paenibacillus ferrarius]|uniref:HTH lysR-type domain-containing protein n=1 Tax=Paenibacillus ferrarius TaxID=1469647 RepID=A0A1V4HPV5_9BACL|nr:LysR family transcriptional regulator [Paenibacillus ferrarius]OPH59982.1 hypothetical protein BC351_18860 [Paenibacillus ferrarius]
MNIEQLEYIVNIARTGSISATAEIMHVSQAGISKSLARLESEIGFELFERTRIGTMPTDRGRIIIEKANEALLKIQDVRDAVLMQNDHIDGEVRLSVSPNFMAVLPKSIVSFKNYYPYVRLEITEKDSIDIIEDIKQNKTDMGLIYLNHEPKVTEELWLTKMFESRVVVCVSKHSWLASKTSVTRKELLTQPFVSINGSFSKRYMEQFKEKYGPVNIIFTSNNQEVLKRTIAEGAAIGIFIEFSIKKDPLITSGEIVAIPLVSDESNIVTFGCVRSKKQNFPRTHQVFLKYLLTEIHSLEK